MTDQYTTASFAGLSIDTFIVAGKEYITPSSMAKGLDKTSQQANDWLRRKNKAELAIDVMVKGNGRAMIAAKAYPVELVAEMVEYWADRGYEPAKALINASFRADLIRTVKEANGIQVTAAQHEATRELIREKLLEEYTKLGAKLGELREAGLVFSDQFAQVAEERNHILFNELTVLEKEVAKERQLDIDYPEWRDDEDESDLVTNRQGEVELNPDQAAWYQRQQDKKTQSQGLGW